ncbi:hypothetical protein LPJ74_004286 [Coemansia sp. RSA 1843]|nr:hypothetical protein LPJ74_004286 [Coemansia sp. RSA 1843]
MQLALRVSETLACKGTQYYVFGDPSYVDKIRDEMLPLVLNRIADAIDKNDYNQMDELMSPYLAKLYKNAAADLDAQGLRMKLDIDVQRQGAKDNYAWLKIGDPEAFDYTIPYSIRNKKYVVGRAVQLVTAVNKNQDNAPGSAGSTPGHNVTAFNQWVALEFGFVVKANVKADLYKGNHIIDGDSGMMEIPVAISTPHYVGIQNMANAVSAGEETETEEPFRWRVSDLFYITGQNNATNIA